MIATGRTKDAYKYREIGEVDFEWVYKYLKFPYVNPTEEDAINIIFTNNTGADKMPFTCWTASHRMGHVFQRSKNLPEWHYFANEVQRDMENIIQTAYTYTVKKVNYGNFPDERGRKLLKALAQDLGTMRSARQRKLRNYFEFPYELLAQYLLTKNKIQFNEPAKLLITHYAWGNAQGLYNRLNDAGVFEVQYLIQAMAEEYNELIKNILDACVGRLFVM